MCWVFSLVRSYVQVVFPQVTGGSAMKVVVSILLVALLVGFVIGMMFTWSPTVVQTTEFTRDFKDGSITIKGEAITLEAEGIQKQRYSIVGASGPIDAAQDTSRKAWMTPRYAIAPTQIVAGDWKLKDSVSPITLHITSSKPMEIAYKVVDRTSATIITIYGSFFFLLLLFAGGAYVLDEY